MIKQIPLIIPNFNLLTYTKNLINWWHFYYPDNKVMIIDNGSTYRPLLDYYSEVYEEGNHRLIDLVWNKENDFRANLKDYLDKNEHEYYVISDPDIMPHPATPANFLEVFKQQIDNGYHHVGFQLIVDDLPNWLHGKDSMIPYEMSMRQDKVNIDGYEGCKAPIDTTFALYSSKNGGWASPMSGQAWSNSLRIFNAFHLPWYINGANLNPEMHNYFSTAKKHITGEPSAGANNYRPKEYE